MGQTLLGTVTSELISQVVSEITCKQADGTHFGTWGAPILRVFGGEPVTVQSNPVISAHESQSENVTVRTRQLTKVRLAIVGEPKPATDAFLASARRHSPTSRRMSGLNKEKVNQNARRHIKVGVALENALRIDGENDQVVPRD